MDKLDERYKKLALEAKAWIEAITGRSFGDGDFIEELSDGVMLCRYVCMWGLRCSGGLFEQLWSRTVVMYTTLCCCAVPPIRSHRAHVCLVWVPAVLVAQADEEAAPWIGKVHQQIQDAVCAPSTRHLRRACLGWAVAHMAGCDAAGKHQLRVEGMPCVRPDGIRDVRDRGPGQLQERDAGGLGSAFTWSYRAGETPRHRAHARSEGQEGRTSRGLVAQPAMRLRV